MLLSLAHGLALSFGISMVEDVITFPTWVLSVYGNVQCPPAWVLSLSNRSSKAEVESESPQFP